MRICFRLDVNSRIGLGHLSRCVALSRYASQDSSCVFFLDKTKSDKKLLSNLDISIEWLSHSNDFFDIISEDHIIILDGYHFNESYFKKIKKKGSFLVRIDDYFKVSKYDDVLFNFCPGEGINGYSETGLTRIFRGLSYFPIEKKLQIKPDASPDRLNNILINFGGSDPDNWTQKILDQINNMTDLRKVHIVLGPGYNFLHTLNKFRKNRRFKFYMNLSKNAFFDLMKECGIAILPASTVSLEYSFIGGILFTIMSSSNQKSCFKCLINEDLAIPYSDENFYSSSNQKSYRSLLKKQRIQSKNNLLNKGFIQIANQASIVLREATIQEVELAFKWATNPEIRKYSFNKKPIDFGRHKNWYIKQMNEYNSIYLFAAINDQMIGSIRFNYKEENRYLISYLVSPQYFGKGLGKSLLLEGLKYIRDKKQVSIEVIGKVLCTNAPSINIFKSLGFKYSANKTNDFLEFKKQIK